MRAGLIVRTLCFITMRLSLYYLIVVIICKQRHTRIVLHVIISPTYASSHGAFRRTAQRCGGENLISFMCYFCFEWHHRFGMIPIPASDRRDGHYGLSSKAHPLAYRDALTGLPIKLPANRLVIQYMKWFWFELWGENAFTVGKNKSIHMIE